MRVVLMCLGVALGCGKVNPTTDAPTGGGSCGDGTVSGTEECDEGVANGTAESCCTATCTFVAASVECRPAAGGCDKAETCTGASGACPANVAQPDGTACTGNGVNVCSSADTCVAGACSNNDLAAGMRCGGTGCTYESCTTTGTCASGVAQNIAIIESESVGGASQNMDTIWQTIAQGLGHTATILPQTTLDDINNLAGYNILIVSGFDIPIAETRRQVIKAFVVSGRGAYVQGEYQSTYEGNQVFLEIVNQLGATFAFAADITGLFTVNATGCAATTPNAVAAMSQNYAATSTSTGNGIAVVKQTTANQAVAWSYCRTGGGLLIDTTDKDDIRGQTAGVPEFMKNVIYELTYAGACTP